MSELPKNSLNNFFQGENPLLQPAEAEVLREWVEENEMSPNTRKAIIGDLKHFLTWFRATNGEVFSFQRLTVRDVSDYKAHSQTRGAAVKTFNRRLVSLRIFCRKGQEAELCVNNPAAAVKQLKLQQLAPKNLPKKELRALLRAVELHDNLRDKLILEMLAGAGFRVGEITNLMVEDIFLHERSGYALVRNGKGGKTRQVPLNCKIRTLLQQYLDEEKLLPGKKLCQGQRGALTPVAINYLLNRYAKKIGIKTHPHCLRHSFAFSYLESNPGDIVGLAQVMGHANIQTTAIYSQKRLEDLQGQVERMEY